MCLLGAMAGWPPPAPGGPLPSFPRFQVAPRPGPCPRSGRLLCSPEDFHFPLPGPPWLANQKQATGDCPPSGGQACLSGGKQSTAGSRSLPLGPTLALSSQQLRQHLPDTLAAPDPGVPTARAARSWQVAPAGPSSSHQPVETMSDYENEDECWTALEGFRVKLISVIDPARITPYLRQCKVLNPDDEEQVLSDPNLVIRKRKVGVLLDILQRTGHKGYVAFLESLELYYPQLYQKVTGKEPTRVFSMIIDASGESGLTQLLMTEVMKLQKKVQDLTALLSSKDDCIKELQVKGSLLRTHQERVQRLKEQCEASGRELKRCKEENYDLALRLARLSEEKGAVLMRSRDLQLEVDRLRHSLMKAEDDCKVERKHTLKLRHAMEQRPSQELLWELQQEKALLQARVQELEASVQEGKPHRNSPYIQVLEEDWRQALREHQEQASTIFSLRKDLRQGEALRNRCMEEREMFELQCQALRKDSKMYKDRIEAVLQQMEEVAIERDQAMASREQLHTQCAQSLQEKDELRKRVRELSEKADELQLQLFQCESRLLAAEGRLKQQQLDTLTLSSDLEDSSPRNSQELSLPPDVEEDAQFSDRGGLAEGETQEQPFTAPQKDAGPSSGEPPEKERRRLKESFENYRRKRALRKMQNGWRQGEGDRGNTTGSDNTDTEGS